jgi:hypothetical protein
MIRLLPFPVLALGFLLAAGEASGQGKTAGTIVGFLTAKGDSWVEIKADGEEKARRYIPVWGKDGPDKSIMKVIADTPLNSRVEMDWRQDNRPRIVKLQVLKKPDTDSK